MVRPVFLGSQKSALEPTPVLLNRPLGECSEIGAIRDVWALRRFAQRGPGAITA